jgi:ATP-dependent exoDNAse (exonuclease V) beta subunit
VVPRLRADGPDGLLVAPIETLGANGRGGQGRRGGDAPEVATFLRAIATEGEREEELRLLYVAATRARSELHLLGAARWRVSQEKGARWEPARNSLLARLWPVIGPHWQELPPPTEATGGPDGEGATEQVLERLPLRWSWPELPEDLPGIRLDGPADAPARAGPEADGVEPAETLPAPALARPPVYEWAGRDARAIGSVVHAALQVIATDGLAAWDARRVTASRPHWRARLAAAGLAGTALETAVARVARAIERTLEDPRGRWCLSPHEAAESEWALSGMMDGELMLRVVDRFLVVDGTVWIIDFKTSSHEGGGLDAFLDNEVERYRPQLEGYARLVGALDPRPIRLGLYFPLLGGWRSWSAGASGARSP